MADFVSLLHLYSQKHSIPAPVFSIQQSEPSTKQVSQELVNCQYIYKCVLTFDDEEFQGTWEKSKASAKKSVAKQAWEYFKSQGNPFFTMEIQEKSVNYTNKLNQLCANIQIPLPHFVLKGFNDSLGPFRGECYVAGKSFIDSGCWTKKLEARESIAKITFMELIRDAKVGMCLENKQAFKIDPKDLHQQFLTHFQQGSNNSMGSSQYVGSIQDSSSAQHLYNSRVEESYARHAKVQDQYSMRYNGNDSSQYTRNTQEGNSRVDKSHFIFPPERNQMVTDEQVPTPNFDDLVDRGSRIGSHANYQRTPISEPINIDSVEANSSSYYNGSNMWYTQPAFDSSNASPFGYGPSSNTIKPEQPDLVVVFDRPSQGNPQMERRNDLEEYANWNARSERPVNYRDGNSFDFQSLRNHSRSRERHRSSSRSPPPHKNRRRRSRSRSWSRSRNDGRKRNRRERRYSSPPPPLSIPANMGRYGTLIYEMAIENPGLGTPNFSTRPSPFIVHEVIAQLAIGHKIFLSATSHAKEIEAIEDVAQIAHEELLRMLEINRKMNEYKTNGSSLSRKEVGKSNGACTELDKDSYSKNRKENLDPEAQEVSNIEAEKVALSNKPKVDSSKDQEITNTEVMLYDDLQNDANSIKPAPRKFTEKFKRVHEPYKKDQIDAMQKKRGMRVDDGNDNITLVSIGKVKLDLSDED